MMRIRSHSTGSIPSRLLQWNLCATYFLSSIGMILLSTSFRLLGGFQTFDILLEKTNKRIRDSWNYVEKENPPSRRFGGRPEGRQSSEMLPGGLVDRYELVAFLGIQFLMGYNRLTELLLYWNRQPDSGYGLGIVHQAMTRERLKFILKHLACADHGELDNDKQLRVRKDPIHKIRSLVDVLNKQISECRRPPRWQSIDEAMVKFKVQSMLRQMMKGKPIKSGFKILSRCCSRGYTYKFEIFYGAQISKTPKDSNFTMMEGVVLDLCEPLEKKGHVVAFNHFFTSIALLDKLDKKRINAGGTILKTRVGQPIFTVNESNLPQDEFVAKFCGEPGTRRKVLFIWKDTKPFQVASNFHGSEVVKVQRKQLEGSFRTNS
jgi:hypothetical protein